jgi:2-polyprenyl-6-methoxyphenol hydroxylase-like FAD-dependent oxidoreductase
MRIVVAGCGMAGTTVAFQLGEQGHQVTLLEQRAGCRPEGAGIMLSQI